MEMPIKSPTVRQVRLRTRIRRWRNASVTARVAASSGPAQAARHAPRLRWTKLDTQPAGREAPPMAPKTPPSPSKATKTGCGSEAVPHAQRQGLLLQRLAVVGATAHSCVQAEVVDVGARVCLKSASLGMPCRPRPRLQARALREARDRPQGRSRVHAQHPAPSAPSARRGLQGQAAACNGLSVRVSSESPSLSAIQVEPSTSTNTPRGVSSLILWVMILCNTACSASSVGADVSTKTGAPSAPHRYTPSSNRQ